MDNKNNNHHEHHEHHDSGGGFFAGIVLGVAVSLLFGTKKGRELVKDAADKGLEKFSEFEKALKKSLEEYEKVPEFDDENDYVKPEPASTQKPEEKKKEERKEVRYLAEEVKEKEEEEEPEAKVEAKTEEKEEKKEAKKQAPEPEPEPEPQKEKVSMRRFFRLKKK